MEDTQQQMTQPRVGVFVEIRSASKRDAHHLGGFVSTKWAQPARVWVRRYDETGKKINEQLVGFIDQRHTGPRSRAHDTLTLAEEYAGRLRAACMRKRRLP